MQLSVTVCVDAPAHEVWAVLADLERITDWAPGIRSAACPAGRETGSNAERHCELLAGIQLVERWTAWDEGTSFTYEGTGLPGVQFARNTWTVTPVSPNRTLLRSDAQVVLRGTLRNRVLSWMVRWQARRAGARSLGAFKHVVETGTNPIQGHRYPAPALC